MAPPRGIGDWHPRIFIGENIPTFPFFLPLHFSESVGCRAGALPGGFGGVSPQRAIGDDPPTYFFLPLPEGERKSQNEVKGGWGEGRHETLFEPNFSALAAGFEHKAHVVDPYTTVYGFDHIVDR